MLAINWTLGARAGDSFSFSSETNSTKLQINEEPPPPQPPAQITGLLSTILRIGVMVLIALAFLVMILLPVKRCVHSFF